MRYIPEAALASRLEGGADEVRLLGLAPVRAPYTLDQADVARLARAIFGPKIGDFERLAKVFATTGILERQAVRPVDWYEAPRGWPERTEAYLDAGKALFIEAAQAALSAARLRAADVDTVVTVSSTGIATPSLEARAFADLGLRADVHRVPVFGLGCAGGVSGLCLAARAGRARLDRTHRCARTLHPRFPPGPGREGGSRGHGTLRRRRGRRGAAGRRRRSGSHRRGRLRVHLAPHPRHHGLVGGPGGIRRDLRSRDPTLRDHGIWKSRRGAPEQDGLEARGYRPLRLPSGRHQGGRGPRRRPGSGGGTLDAERAVLRDHGNMSAPTALFVLDRVLRSGFDGRAILSALGPGFSASFVSLRVPDGRPAMH